MSLPDDVEAVLLAAEKPLTIGEVRERLTDPGIATMPIVMALTALKRKGLARECRNASDLNAWARCSSGEAHPIPSRPVPTEGLPHEPLTQRILRLLGASLGPLTSIEISSTLAVKGDLVSATLSNLRNQGRIERRGDGRPGKWALIDVAQQAAARAERRAAAPPPAADASEPAAPTDVAAPAEEDSRRERLSDLIAEIGDRINGTTEQLAQLKRAYSALLKECREPKAPQTEEAHA